MPRTVSVQCLLAQCSPCSAKIAQIISGIDNLGACHTIYSFPKSLENFVECWKHEPPGNGTTGLDTDYNGVPPDLLRSILRRPYSLPKRCTMAVSLHEPLCAPVRYHYKLEASMGLTADTQLDILCLFDTGVVRNLNRAEHLPDLVLRRLDNNRMVVILCSASSHNLTVLGMIDLTVRLAYYKCLQPFVLVVKLASDALLGTSFIDEHVEYVWIRHLKALPHDGSEI